jgi:predicted phosphodiesterase
VTLLTRIGLIGDIHCEDVRLAAALAHLHQLGVDRMCAVGDIVDGYGDVNRCCTLLEEHRVLAVAGNHERWILAQSMRELPEATPFANLDPRSREFLTALPRTLRLSTPLGEALLCHGIGEDDMTGVRPGDFGYALETNDALTRAIARGERLILNGHTHRKMVRRIDGLTIINAGTLAHDWDPCFALVDFGQRTVQYFDVDLSGYVLPHRSLELPSEAPSAG